jgi:hypothetical protein
MTFDSLYVLAQLQELERQIAETPRQIESLRLAYLREDRSEILCNLVDSQRLLSALVATTARLRTRIVATDGLGTSLEFLPELALRAVRMVLLTELAALRDVVGSPYPPRRGQAQSRGRFRTVHDLVTFVHEELDQITRAWSGHRDRPWSDRQAFRAGVYAAARAMQRLGRVPDLASFLCEGSHRPDWPELAAICARIRAALDIGIAAQSDRPLLLHARRLHEITVAEQQ